MILTEIERGGTVDYNLLGMKTKIRHQLIGARLRTILRIAQAVGVASFKIVLCRCARQKLIITVGVVARGRDEVIFCFPIVEIIEAGEFCRGLSRLVLCPPSTVSLAWNRRVIDIVHLSREGKPVFLGVAHCEGTRHVAAVAAKGKIGVSYHALPIVLFQVHVEHILFVAHVCPHQS